MAMIHLKEGGTFFGDIKDYNWKGKFLVVTLPALVVAGKPELRILSWDNVESVYDTDNNREELKDTNG